MALHANVFRVRVGCSYWGYHMGAGVKAGAWLLRMFSLERL